jgi:hypothetical protein
MNDKEEKNNDGSTVDNGYNEDLKVRQKTSQNRR